MVDRRLWTPDETCEPFLLEYSSEGADNLLIGTFTVPAGQEAVIASICCGAAASVFRNEEMIAILRGRPSLITRDSVHAISINGSIGNGGQSPISLLGPEGFYVGSDAGVPRPCRIRITSGDYSVCRIGNGTYVGGLGVSLYGWSYSLTR